MGNELFAEGFEVYEYDLPKANGGGGFESKDANDCKDECYIRDEYPKCGGWTYKAGFCYLKGTEACFGQRSKQMANQNAASGYFCKCWSTVGQCYHGPSREVAGLIHACPFHAVTVYDPGVSGQSFVRIYTS